MKKILLILTLFLASSSISWGATTEANDALWTAEQNCKEWTNLKEARTDRHARDLITRIAHDKCLTRFAGTEKLCEIAYRFAQLKVAKEEQDFRPHSLSANQALNFLLTPHATPLCDNHALINAQSLGAIVERLNTLDTLQNTPRERSKKLISALSRLMPRLSSATITLPMPAEQHKLLFGALMPFCITALTNLGCEIGAPVEEAHQWAFCHLHTLGSMEHTALAHLEVWTGIAVRHGSPDNTLASKIEHAAYGVIRALQQHLGLEQTTIKPHTIQPRCPLPPTTAPLTNPADLSGQVTEHGTVRIELTPAHIHAAHTRLSLLTDIAPEAFSPIASARWLETIRHAEPGTIVELSGEQCELIFCSLTDFFITYNMQLNKYLPSQERKSKEFVEIAHIFYTTKHKAVVGLNPADRLGAQKELNEMNTQINIFNELMEKLSSKFLGKLSDGNWYPTPVR